MKPAGLTRLWLGLLLSLGLGNALAESRQTTLYRCGPEGRELRDRPCPAEPGASSTINYEQPSASDRRAAEARARAEARRAAQMHAEREREDARERRAHALAQPLLAPAASSASAPERAHAKPHQRQPVPDGQRVAQPPRAAHKPSASAASAASR